MTDDLARGLIIIGCGAFLLLVGLCWLILSLSSYECSARATQMQRQHQFSMWTGCMIRTKQGEWVPLGAYRVVE